VLEKRSPGLTAEIKDVDFGSYTEYVLPSFLPFHPPHIFVFHFTPDNTADNTIALMIVFGRMWLS
jgi:hypothetical protein